MRKSNIKYIKIAVIIAAFSSLCITLLTYYYSHTAVILHKFGFHREKKTTTEHAEALGRPMKHISLKEIYDEVGKKNSDENFAAEDYKTPLLLDTPGCQIPLYSLDNTRPPNKTKHSCGERPIVLKRVDENSVLVSIQENRMKKLMRKTPFFECCYRFISTGEVTKNLRYSACTKLKHGMIIKLESDFINIKCFENEITHPVTRPLYNDMYAFTKKINTSRLPRNNCTDKYNVLMIGIDSMSLLRLGHSMQKTINFFRDNFWVAVRGYHKIGDNTFPNLMAALTGKNLTYLNDKCSGHMDQCNHLLIWSKFREAGYVTAYGEDYLRLPDTFHDEYNFFRAPTDHYLKPLFLMGETEINSTVCAGKQPSGQQLLDFALDFAITYRQESFFGLFWINSFSHNAKNHPAHGDSIIENFLNRISYTGVLENTFVILFSDHGIRFGEGRMTVGSYYDERLPILFIWSPNKFKAKHPIAYRNLVLNQFKLVTPYDLYKTLLDINYLSKCQETNRSNIKSEGCPNCHSLFQSVDGNRTCKDVAISEKWCSCHKLYPLDTADPEGIRSAMYVVTYVKSKVKTVKTVRRKRCWVCLDLSLAKIQRIHFYYDASKVNLYHVIAFTMTPGNVSYEATVLRKGKEVEIVGKVSMISPYRGLGQCAASHADRIFCVCKMKEKKYCSGESHEYNMTND